jgi:hypothetical protein
VGHAASLDVRLPRAHPATVGYTPAEWLEKTAVPLAPEAGQDETPPVGGGVTEACRMVRSMGRLVGVDLARALAVFGMYVVHIGPPLSATDGVGS